jgi:hypothetical protein
MHTRRHGGANAAAHHRRFTAFSATLTICADRAGKRSQPALNSTIAAPHLCRAAPSATPLGSENMCVFECVVYMHTVREAMLTLRVLLWFYVQLKYCLINVNAYLRAIVHEAIDEKK